MGHVIRLYLLAPLFFLVTCHLIKKRNHGSEVDPNLAKYCFRKSCCELDISKYDEIKGCYNLATSEIKTQMCGWMKQKYTALDTEEADVMREEMCPMDKTFVEDSIAHVTENFVREMSRCCANPLTQEKCTVYRSCVECFMNKIENNIEEGHCNQTQNS